MKGNLYIISGPAGAGKTEIVLSALLVAVSVGYAAYLLKSLPAREE